MRYRRISSDYDYVFGNGQYDFLTDTEAFAQAVKTRLRLYRGEWWENLLDGLPLYQEILGSFITSDEDKDMITQIYLNEIAGIEGFSSFAEVNSDYDGETREYSLSCSVETSYGTTETLEVV